MEPEYNRLTRTLLEEGYDETHYPKHVEIGRPARMNGSGPLDNYEGGFIYKRWWIYEQVFKTPCGLQCKGSSCMSNMSYMGLEWDYENDLALVHCPYDKFDCPLKHPYMRKSPVDKYHCNVHLVEEEYQYEGSVEGIQKLYDDEIERKAISFSMQRHGRACRHHMRYDRKAKAWNMHYDPAVCAMMKCKGECPILGRELDKKRGNVFYDIKETGRRYDLDGTLFEGQTFTNLIKGKRAFESPISMDICKIYAKLCIDEIRRKEEGRHYIELFFAKYHGREYAFEIQNIRAEQRESRDLMQDLADIENGIQIIHESDKIKQDKQQKSEHRKQLKEKKIKKLEKKLLEVGYYNMDEFSLDRVHADKWLGSDRIDELEAIREKKKQEEKNQPVQLSMF